MRLQSGSDLLIIRCSWLCNVKDAVKTAWLTEFNLVLKFTAFSQLERNLVCIHKCYSMGEQVRKTYSLWCFTGVVNDFVQEGEHIKRFLPLINPSFYIRRL